MPQEDRIKLLSGPYRTPKCKVGGSLRCRIRERVRVAGLTDAPIQWPYVPRFGGNGKPSLILTGDLVRAVQRESAAAVAHLWGVSIITVWKWRKALGVERQTEGTTDLQRRTVDQHFDDDTRRKVVEATQRPERNAKIAATKRGKPRPAHVIEAMRKANVGRKPTQAARKKMSDSHKRRFELFPHPMAWKPEEDAMLGTMMDAEVAQRIGRDAKAVHKRRKKLGIAAFVKRKPHSKPPAWTPGQDQLLGTMSDSDLARKLRCTKVSVFKRRRKLWIAAFCGFLPNL